MPAWLSREDWPRDERPEPRDDRAVRALDEAFTDREPLERRPPPPDAARELPLRELPLPRELAEALRLRDPDDARPLAPRRLELEAPELRRLEPLALRRPDVPVRRAPAPRREALAPRPAPPAGCARPEVARPRDDAPLRRCFSCIVSGYTSLKNLLSPVPCKKTRSCSSKMRNHSSQEISSSDGSRPPLLGPLTKSIRRRPSVPFTRVGTPPCSSTQRRISSWSLVATALVAILALPCRGNLGSGSVRGTRRAGAGQHHLLAREPAAERTADGHGAARAG